MAASVPIPVNLDASGGRTQPGEARAARRSVHWEIFRRVDPDRLRHSERPPEHLERAIAEVFGEDAKRLKLRVHPLLRRWTLFEVCHDPKTGQENSWHAISYFYGEPTEGYLPPDLRDNKYTRHLTGQVGDFRMPTKRDFELIYDFNVGKHGYLHAENTAAKPEIELEKDAERQMEAIQHDFLDYHFWMAMREAQDHVSRPWSTPAVELSPHGGRWIHIDKGSFKMRVPFGSRQHIQEIKSAIREAEEELGLNDPMRRRGRSQAEIEAAREEYRAELRLAEEYRSLKDNPSELQRRASEWHQKRMAHEAIQKAVNG